jgi:hypothetical protein
VTPETVSSTAIRSSGGIFRGSPFDQNWTGEIAYEGKPGDKYSHASIFEANPQLLGKDDLVTGFITSTGRFVDRIEGYHVATASGQIPHNEVGQLFSEDFLADHPNN